MKKPELLLPAGNSEAFYAALKGGADAVYLGLKKFNARDVADNFTVKQLVSVISEAKKEKVKVYVTLNTVIKNTELPDLLETLWQISQVGVHAVIIQDWGVYYMVKKHFPNITLHASTQMANHNSQGGEYSKHKGFERVIMARELTMDELKSIRRRTSIQLEIFAHGALCYSFSGMCLFSSYLGGMSANRGMCKQPCRRLFYQFDEKKYIFSLKDNQLISYVPDMMRVGIESLKIEGRLKPAEYVNRVAKAYRLAVDEPDKVEDAADLLKLDMGREKTSYFMGGNVSEAITTSPTTGLYIGDVVFVKKDGFVLNTDFKLEKGNRLRIRTKKGDERIALKIKVIEKHQRGLFIPYTEEQFQVGDKVFLANLRQDKFPNNLPEVTKDISFNYSTSKRESALKDLLFNNKNQNEQLIFRVDTIDWLRKIRLQDVDGIILSLPKKQWEEINLNAPFLKNNSHKIYFEFPKFIPEKDVIFYQKKAKDWFSNGYSNFMLSHLSQKMMVPKGAKYSTNENVYVFNDAAAKLMMDEGVNQFTYPFENELDNLMESKSRNGIVPMYFRPELFYSRMPIKLVFRENDEFQSDEDEDFIRSVKDGVTIVTPTIPVALTQYMSKLHKAGFRKFLFDLSHEKISKHLVKRLINKAQYSEQIQPSVTFNFVKGLT